MACVKNATTGQWEGCGQTGVVSMPGYGGQCAVVGYNKDAQGNRINIIVAMPGGAQRTFATESDFQAACVGAVSAGSYAQVAQPSYAPPAYVPGPTPVMQQQPQNININIPASSGGGTDSALWDAYFRSMSQPPVTQSPAVQSPSTWQYIMPAGGSGVDVAPSGPTVVSPADMQAQEGTPAAAPAPSANSGLIWAIIGGGLIFALAGKGKK